MKTNYITGISLCMLSLNIISCNPGIYVPACQNVPLLQKKGEINLQIGQTNIQGAVAVSQHVGIAMNAQYIGTSGRDRLLTPRRSSQLRVELAGGYFTQRKTLNSLIYELYAGGGYGKVDYKLNLLTNLPSTNPTAYNLTFTLQNWNVFIQPAIGIRRKRGSVALSTKINYVGYTNATTRTDLPLLTSPLPSIELDNLVHTHCLFFEPALTATAGGNPLRVMLQLFYSTPLINQSQFQVINPNQTFVRFGFLLELNRKKKRQKSD